MFSIATSDIAETVEADTDRDVYTLAAGDLLFHEGEAKRAIFRIESGSVCTYQICGNDPRRNVSLSHAGDWLGFGYLDRHVCRARALVDTRLTRYPRYAADLIIETDLRARRQLADAIEREFEHQRDTGAKRAANPLVRVCALLLSLASIGAQDGRDPRIVVDSLPSGLMADCLLMSVESLAATLRRLQAEGLIDLVPGGIRLVNFSALQSIADGDCSTAWASGPGSGYTVAGWHFGL